MRRKKPVVNADGTTRLDTYMREWGVMSSAFARRSGISRPHLLRLRKGDAEPSRRVMVALTETASLMRESPVYMVELFELAPSDETVYLALLEERRKRRDATAETET
jgi:transcriptional regulator with XRE-family HTH domain